MKSAVRLAASLFDMRTEEILVCHSRFESENVKCRMTFDSRCCVQGHVGIGDLDVVQCSAGVKPVVIQKLPVYLQTAETTGC